MTLDNERLRSALFVLPIRERRVVNEVLDDLWDTLHHLVEAEDDPCRLDHHGYCQEHWRGEIDGVCAIAYARRLVGLDAHEETP